MDPLRIGILGCGGIAGHHARQLAAMDDAAIVALCDVNPEQVERFREANLADAPAPAAYTDPAAMYAEAGLDAVVIATPHTLHYAQGLEALDAGCHIFMEKPMVTNADDAYAFAERVKQAEKIVTVGYCTPATRPFGFLRDRIREGTYGRLELVTGYLCQDWLRLTTGMWRQDPALSGGGQAYDSGAHLMASLIWSVEQPIDEVFAFVDNHGAAVDINSAIAVRFANGVMASLAIGGNCAKGGQHMSFIFENGRVEIDGWGGSYIKVFADGHEETPDLGGDAVTPIRNFVDAVLGRDEPKTAPIHGIHHTELMDAIYASARSGRPVRPARREAAA
ncbi:MAG: Gfo/Idh/MocA family protein [Planctomycetota bacterium]